MSEVKTNDAGGGFWSNIYSGTSSLGEFRATLGLIIGIILGIILILGGTYMITYNDDHKYLEIDGKVMKSACQGVTTYDTNNRPNTSYKCNIVVGYKINDKTYSQPIFIRSNEDYMESEPVSLWVNKADYKDVKLAKIYTSIIGSAMVGGAVLLMGLAYLNYYMTHRFEVYAAAQGADTIIDVFK